MSRDPLWDAASKESSALCCWFFDLYEALDARCLRAFGEIVPDPLSLILNIATSQ